MSALSECYARVTSAYGAGGPNWDPNLGHRGADYYRLANQWIIAYDDMIIESINYGDGLGNSVGLRRLNEGGFCGFAHIKNLQGGRGTRIPKGGRIAQVAGWSDVHGTLWTGPHIHTTQGAISSYNCAVGIRPLSDPVPVITRAVSSGSTAGGGSTPLPTPTPKPTPPIILKDEDDMSKNFGIYTSLPDNTVKYLIGNTDSGFCTEWSNGTAAGPMPGAYNNALAIAFDTGAFAAVTAGHYDVIKRSLVVVDDDPVSVDVNDPGVQALINAIDKS